MISQFKFALILILTAVLLVGCGKSVVDTDLIPVSNDEGKWGYVDHDGKIVINFQFKSAACFSDGLARVANDDQKIGYINKEGKFVINATYKYGTVFSEGLAAVVMEDGGPMFINTKGEIKFKLPGDIEEVDEFREDLAVVKNSKGLYGFIDKDGKTKITIQFEYAESFSDGLALVKQKDKYGYIDKDGKLKINYQFEQAYWFANGLAVAGTNKSLGYIDKEGNYKINPQFEAADNFNNGLAAVKSDKKFGYIDKDGKMVINPQFKGAMPFKEKIAVVSTDSKIGIIDKEGKILVNPQFSGAIIVNNNLIIVSTAEGKFGFVDKEGKYTVNPQFKDIDASLIWNNSSNIVGYVVPRSYYRVESDFLDMSPILNKLLEGTSPTSFMNISSKTTRGEFTSKSIEKIDENNSISYSSYCNTVTAPSPEYYYDPIKANSLAITSASMNLYLNGKAYQKKDALLKKIKEELLSKTSGTLEPSSSDQSFTIKSGNMSISINGNYSISISVSFPDPNAPPPSVYNNGYGGGY